MSRWALPASLIAGVVMAPMIALGLSAEFSAVFRQFDFISIALTTLGVGLGVLVCSVVIAVPLAWFTGVCRIPYRLLWHTLLMVPLAIPSYILAFVYIGALDFSSPLSTMLRGWGIVMPPIRTVWGLILVLTLSLYPYIYALTRSAFISHGQLPMEIAQSLGYRKRQAFFKVLLPMSYPWISQGALLVLLEVLADFGAVSIFNVRTFTTAIYTAWYGYFSLGSASAIAMMLLGIATGLFVINHRFQTIKNHFSPQYTVRQTLYPLTRWQVVGVLIGIVGVVGVSMGIPVIQLVLWSIEGVSRSGVMTFLPALGKSVMTSVMATGIIVALGLVLVWSHRFGGGRYISLCVGVARFGYAIPGSVLAVACFQLFKHPLGMGVMLLAYTVRYLSLAINPLMAGIHRIPRSVDEVSQSLKVGTWGLMKKIHLPLLSPSLVSAGLMTSMDVIKEMPIALMARPFGWDTLSVAIYSYTEEGLWEMAAFPALLLLVICSLPTVIYGIRSQK